MVSTLTFVKIFDLCGLTPLTPTHSYVLSYEASHIQNVAFVPARVEGSVAANAASSPGAPPAHVQGQGSPSRDATMFVLLENGKLFSLLFNAQPAAPRSANGEGTTILF